MALTMQQVDQTNLEPYEDGFAMLFDLLQALDKHLLHATETVQQKTAGQTELNLRGIVISDAEVEQKLKENDQSKSYTETSLWQCIEKRVAASRDTGIYLPLEILRQRFDLIDFEMDCIVACLSVEMHSKYEKVFAYLNDDVTRKYPTPFLLTKLFKNSAHWDALYRRFFTQDAPLMKHRILYGMKNGQWNTPKQADCLFMDDEIIRFLLQEPGIEKDLAELFYTPNYTPHTPKLWELSTVQQKQEIHELLERYLANNERRQRPLLITLNGPSGCGRYYTYLNACSSFDMSAMVIDCETLLEMVDWEERLLRVFRNSLLYMTPILLTNFELFVKQKESQHNLLTMINRILDDYGWLAFFAVAHADVVKHRFKNCQVEEIDFNSQLSHEQRKRNWQELINSQTTLPEDASQSIANELAEKFHLTPSQIADAVYFEQENLDTNQSVVNNLLHKSAAKVSMPNLGKYARRFKAVANWEDIVLSDKKVELLKDIVRQVRYRSKVYDQWGFGGKMNRGKGVSALFFGPSGTGKTMAVEVIANELGLEVYRVDLSVVVSKYIGETEKNLSQIFQEAQHSDVILFFDEADALFGKRSEVKDAHDRYANIETNYLLQQFENYSGIVVLATNMRSNMDKAFMRRIKVSVKFEQPDENDRLKIWQKAFPVAAPKEDLDLKYLAKAFDLSGGNIVNIGLSSAFLAAEQDCSISMRHVATSIQQELLKCGRRCFKQDFGPYADMVSD